MHKLQIQLPSPLYQQLKRLSKRLDYSMAELLRRGAEHIVQFYPETVDNNDEKAWVLPDARPLGLKITDPRRLRDLAYERD